MRKKKKKQTKRVSKVKGRVNKTKSKAKSKKANKRSIAKQTELFTSAPEKLPKYLIIDGVKYFTPTALRALRHKGQITSNVIKVATYTAYIRNGRKKTLNSIVDLFYTIRDRYILDPSTYNSNSRIEEIIFELLEFENEYYVRNEILARIDSVHEQFPNIKTFKWQCYTCDKIGFYPYGEALAQSEIELSYMWEARDMYLQTVSDESMQFEVKFWFETLTRFAFIDFNDLGVIGANLVEFLEILKFVKYGKAEK